MPDVGAVEGGRGLERRGGDAVKKIAGRSAGHRQGASCRCPEQHAMLFHDSVCK